jgi:MFS family permease
LPWLDSSVLTLALFLLLFFTPFNVLEALLPSLTSRLAPPGAKGVAIGLYSSIQFFGTFVGAAGGGYAYGRWGLTGVVIADVVLLVVWLVLSLNMRAPVVLSTRTYTVPRLDARDAETLTARLRALSGVHDARVVAGESIAFLTVDSGVFDEHNVLNAITEKAG